MATCPCPAGMRTVSQLLGCPHPFLSHISVARPVMVQVIDQALRLGSSQTQTTMWHQTFHSWGTGVWISGPNAMWFQCLLENATEFQQFFFKMQISNKEPFLSSFPLRASLSRYHSNLWRPGVNGIQRNLSWLGCDCEAHPDTDFLRGKKGSSEERGRRRCSRRKEGEGLWVLWTSSTQQGFHFYIHLLPTLFFFFFLNLYSAVNSPEEPEEPTLTYPGSVLIPVIPHYPSSPKSCDQDVTNWSWLCRYSHPGWPSLDILFIILALAI